MSELDDLRDAVTALHGCTASHSYTAKVHERMGSQTVWKGEVEVFDVAAHPDGASEVYAWSWDDDSGERQYMAVANIPPVKDPADAVKAAIASGKQV